MKKLGLLVASMMSLSVMAQDMDMFLPPLNAKVIQFVNKNIGKKVDRGECWDLAAKALEFADARHEETYDFGRDLKKHEVPMAGDIIQFENTKIRRKLDLEGGEIVMDIPHHTAIIYEVQNKTKFKIADQNNGISGEKVSVNEIDLNNMERGTYTIFRPEKK